jgi:hypothetical protein
MIDAGGSLWAIITIGFVVLLGLGMAYGTWMWRRAPRDPETTRRKDEATRRNYSDNAVEEVPLVSSDDKDENAEDENKRWRRAN